VPHDSCSAEVDTRDVKLNSSLFFLFPSFFFVMSAELPAPLTAEQKTSGQRVIVILEDAPLEVVKVKHGFQLANCDDHRGLLQNAKRDPAEMRPDITHQCLMTLLDSPLNKAGRLVIYIHTAKNVVIEVSPQLRVPRTYKRFAGLFVELLQRHKIRAKDGSEILMKVVSGPVSKYLPVNGRKIGFSVNGKLVLLREHVKSLPECQPPKRPLLLEEGDAADDAAEPQKKKKGKRSGGACVICRRGRLSFRPCTQMRLC